MINATTSLPVDRRRVDEPVSGPPDDDDDEDYHEKMTSFGSGYYDYDDDADYGDGASVRPRLRDAWPPESSPSSSRRRPEDRRPSDRQLKDVSRTLSTTPAAAGTLSRDWAVSATRRQYVERRRPVGSVTSSSSSAARRRHYADKTATSGATSTLAHPLYTLSPFLRSVAAAAAILFSSAHVFLSLPVT